MFKSHNSVRYSHATRVLLDAMYSLDITEQKIHALLKTSTSTFFLNSAFRDRFSHNWFIGSTAEGPDINAITLVGETILHRAIRLQNSGIVKLLLSHKANVHIPDQHGVYPLHAAVHVVEKIIPSFKENFKEIVELLLAHNADPNVRDRDGNTPLHIAAKKGLDKVASLLIDKGADVNAQNNQGITPLACIVTVKENEILDVLIGRVIKLLIEKDADPMICSKNGRNVFTEALEKNRQHLIPLQRPRPFM